MLHQVELGRWLRTSTWAAVRIRHDQHGLSVWHGGRRWVTDYQIRGWDPKPSWRLGVGARSGRWPERHWLDWLELESEMLARPNPNPNPNPNSNPNPNPNPNHAGAPPAPRFHPAPPPRAHPRPALAPPPRAKATRALSHSLGPAALSRPPFVLPLHPAAPCPRSPRTLAAGGGGRDDP